MENLVKAPQSTGPVNYYSNCRQIQERPRANYLGTFLLSAPILKLKNEGVSTLTPSLISLLLPDMLRVDFL